MLKVQEINKTARTPFVRYKTGYVNVIPRPGDGQRRIDVELRAVKDPNANPLRFASKDTVRGYLFSWQESNIWPVQTVIINARDQGVANKIVRKTLDKYHEDGHKHSPLEIMHWLRWSSPFSTMEEKDGKSLLEWYPQVAEPLPIPGSFVISTAKSFPYKHGNYTNLQIRAVQDLNDQKSPAASSETDINGYLLSCSQDDFFGTRASYCQIRTCDPELAHEIFNFTASEIEKNSEIADYEIIGFLTSQSRYCSVGGTLPDYKNHHLVAWLDTRDGNYFTFPD